ncbi:ATP-binding protein [Amycolatopsis sp. NPDC051128]|uniref:ATP-binding protein n=1 Tax=Amycolatopsis sp. NPDC051128 TaxID=3155412 RepID=UPI00344AC696
MTDVTCTMSLHAMSRAVDAYARQRYVYARDRFRPEDGSQTARAGMIAIKGSYPSHVLGELVACRIDELQRPPISDGEVAADLARRQRLATLIALYHAGTARPGPAPTFALGWQRRHTDGPIDLYAGGNALSVTRPDGQAVLTVPVGGRGRRLPVGGLAAELRSTPCWTRIDGITDGLVVEATATQQPDRLHPSLEDCLLRAWHEPFAWLLMAEPIPPDVVATEAARIGELQRDASTRGSPGYAVRTARLAHRHQELHQAQSTGLWHVWLIAGGTSPAAAVSVAGLLAASADLSSLPYVLAPTATTGALDEILDARLDGPDRASPFAASSALVASLGRGPNEEIPGVRLTLRPPFDVTTEPASGAPGLRLGRLLDRNRAEVDDVHIPRDSLNRHMLVAGATGSGKSHTLRGLLEQASQVGLPWLVIEPAKAEYRLMASRLGPGSVLAIRPGDPDAIPAGLNPLEPAAGFPLQTHVDLVRALFTGAFQSEEPFPQVLSAALTRCYDDLGWDLALGEPKNPALTPRYPTLTDLQRTAERVVADIGYGREVTDNVLGFIRVRLASLRLGTTGRFFEGGHPVDFAALLQHNVIVEIEDVGDDRDKAFLMGTMLIRLIEHLRVQQHPTTGLRHLTVVEEAHRLLRRAEQPGPAAQAVELFAGLLAEIRAYGEGLIIAEQIPSKLVPDVIKNTAVKIVHRLPALDDRDTVGATMNLTEPQSRYLVTLQPGTGALFTDGMDFPLLVQIPDTTALEATTAAIIAVPTTVVARRSTTCGLDCVDTPCTLRQVRAAQRMPETEPWLPAWAELSVLAHLTGQPTPYPRQPALDVLTRLPTRLRDCAISHAVDTAVATRSTAIATTHSPAQLAAHIANTMRAYLTGQRVCADEEPEWLATPFRWNLVHHELEKLCHTTPAADRHPRSKEWAQTYRRPIPGDTADQQRQTVRAWFNDDLRDTATCDAIAWGLQTPASIETVVGSRRNAPDWPDRLTETFQTFTECNWAHQYLKPADIPADGNR